MTRADWEATQTSMAATIARPEPALRAWAPSAGAGRACRARRVGPFTKRRGSVASDDGPVTLATKPYGTRDERTQGHWVQPPRTHWGREFAARTQRIDGRSPDQPARREGSRATECSRTRPGRRCG